MWTLILTLITSDGAVAIHSIPMLQTENHCLAARNQWYLMMEKEPRVAHRSGVCAQTVGYPNQKKQ